MNLTITHISEYAYSDPVRLHPHFFRMSPLPYPHLEVESLSIRTTPVPSGSAWIMDAEHNKVLHSWFLGETTSLRIETEITVSTKACNPFEFVYYPLEAFELDFLLSMEWPDVFHSYLATEFLPDDLLTILQDLKTTHRDSSDFVKAMALKISEECTSEVRETGAPWPAATTWDKRAGSCRDLSWLMIQLLRTAGIPTRFTSGYHYAPDLTNHELHAWVEVYLPGGGWVGLDPSTGFPVDESYIPVASSAHPEWTLPVEGVYSGYATANLRTSVTLTSG